MQTRSQSPRPPVPPKDTPQRRVYSPDSMVDNSPSYSKRKRDESVILDVNDVDDLITSEHTPKRLRTSPVDARSEESDTGQQQGNLRRKKGVSNLSSMSLRHQALEQMEDAIRQQENTRPSKFAEGSLTDKPSQKPPSTYLRDDADSHAFDRLAEEYITAVAHTDTELESVHSNMQMNEVTDPQAEAGGFLYRFGQKIANTFRPGPMWNRIWNETKEELTLKNMAAAERKRLQDQEAGNHEGTVRRRGQLKRKSLAHLGGFSGRDSGIAFPQRESVSSQLSLRPSIEDEPHKSTLRGRLHFKKPSLGNLRNDLKRARSDYNLGHSSTRESSWSLSPVKLDAEPGSMAQSQSRADLKKQKKLSKRVSDLESKLQTAREELGEALAQASPMPNLSSKYNRFSASTVKKSEFVPGMLPSLPSESFFAAGLTPMNEASQVQQPTPSEDVQDQGENAQLTEGFDKDRTIKASQQRSYPALGPNLFMPNTASVQHYDDNGNFDKMDMTEDELAIASTMAEFINPAALQAQPSDDTSVDWIAVAEVTPMKNHNDDSQSPKTSSSKKVRAKKRKAGHEEAAYKPKKSDEDDSEPSKAGVKKRKAAGPRMIIRKRSGAQADGYAKEESIEQSISVEQPRVASEDAEQDESNETSVRRSLDSSVHSLEPLYEEEEEAVMIPVKDAPSRPTATATPARLGRLSRSRSPVKRALPAKAGAEEIILTRAADAVRNHPGRQMGVDINGDEYEWPDDVF